MTKIIKTPLSKAKPHCAYCGREMCNAGALSMHSKACLKNPDRHIKKPKKIKPDVVESVVKPEVEKPAIKGGVGEQSPKKSSIPWYDRDIFSCF